MHISLPFIKKTIMMSTIPFAFIAVFHLICGSYASPLQDVELPQNIKICSKHESYYATCLANAIQESWPVFVKGIPELDFPPLEPFTIARFERNLNVGQFVGSVVLNNMTYLGFADTKFVTVQPRFTGNHITLDMYVEIPKVVIKSDYKVQATVDSVNIGGKGHFNVSAEGFSARWILDGYVKNDRLIVKQFHVDPEIKGMKVYFSDVFNGNQVLNNAALILVNQAWPMLFNGVKPIVVEISDVFLTDFLNRSIFSKVAVSKLFP